VAAASGQEFASADEALAPKISPKIAIPIEGLSGVSCPGISSRGLDLRCRSVGARPDAVRPWSRRGVVCRGQRIACHGVEQWNISATEASLTRGVSGERVRFRASVRRERSSAPTANSLQITDNA